MIRIIILTLLLSSKLYAIDENFSSLSNWKELHFPKVKKHSTYKIIENSILEAKAESSASALVYKKKFNVYEKPNLEFKWKAQNIFKKGDYTSKSGDDYPIRVYVFFDYDKEQASFTKRLKYDAAKTLYGEYPPDSSLNYIWSSKVKEKGFSVDSPYSKQAQLIMLQSGEANLNTWQIEKINIIEDYKKAFGKEPPKTASIAIMADSDNTKESATSYIDWVKVH